MLEKEVWSEITKDLYEEKLKEFTNSLGKPRFQNRVAIRMGHSDNIALNTRMKIDDGKPFILQKTGGLNNMNKNEVELALPEDLDYFVELFEIIKNLLIYSETGFMRLLQFENALFKTKNYEVKLTHQYGKTDIYSFEVEVNKEEFDPVAISKKLGLEPDLSVKTNEFWMNYSDRVNFNIKDWTIDQLKGELSRYLKK